MAGATFLGHNEVGQSANSLNTQVPLPSGATAGDFYIVGVSGEETTPSVTWAASATSVTITGASRTNASWVCAAGFLSSTDISNNFIQATFTTSKQRTGHILTFDHTTIAASSYVDASIGNNWTSQLSGAATLTTTTADDALVFMIGNQSAVSFGYGTPSGFSTAGGSVLSVTTGMCSAAFYNADQAATGSTTATGTWTTTNRNGVALLVALLTVAGSSATGSATVTLAGTGAAAATAPSGAATVTLAGTGTAVPAADTSSLLMVGDSLTFAGGTTATMEADFAAAGWGGQVHVDGVTGRFVYNAGDTGGGTPAVLDGWAASGYHPRDLVVALGTNDTLSANSTTWLGAVNNLRAKIATDLPSVTRIWWVNLVADSTGGQGMDGIIGSHGNSVADYNTFLTSTLNGTSEKILDWNTYAKANLTSSSYWQNDSNHVHMTSAGYTARETWIAGQMQTHADTQPATGSATLTLSGAGTDAAAATGTATVTLAATGTARVAATSSATVTLTATGTAGATSPSGSATVTLAGTGLASAPGTATGAATVTLTATGAGAATAAAGSATVTLTAVGVAVNPGSFRELTATAGPTVTSYASGPVGPPAYAAGPATS